MKIVDAKVIITCPGRNFVTLKITTDDGLYVLASLAATLVAEGVLAVARLLEEGGQGVRGVAGDREPVDRERLELPLEPRLLGHGLASELREPEHDHARRNRRGPFLRERSLRGLRIHQCACSPQATLNTRSAPNARRFAPG